jgi:hypothetical protein
MRTIWQALAWKEWHEHKWKLAALVMVLCGVNTFVLLSIYRDHRQDLFDVAYALTICCVVPLSLFTGASVAAGERSRGTARFLQAMPVSPTVAALIKLLAGLATLVASIALTFAFVYVWYECARTLGYDVQLPAVHSNVGPPQPFELNNWFVNRAAIASLVACSFYLWTAAAGVNRQDEVSAAARGALAMVVWCLALLMAGRWFDQKWLWSDGWWIVAMFLSASPGAIGIFPIPRSHNFAMAILGVPWPIVTGYVFHFGLAYWYVSRFGRTDVGSVRSPQPAHQPATTIDWLGPPRRSPLTAIAWKQGHESGPLVLIGLAGILAIVAVVGIINWRDLDVDVAIQAYAAVTVSAGLMIALVVGIGVMLFDLSPAINTFWRSRPINPDLWYWTKLVTGLLVIIAALYVPLLVAVSSRHGESVRQALRSEEVMMFPAVTIGIYCAAVMMTCLVRQAIYAAILSIGALYLGFFALVVIERAITLPWDKITWEDLTVGEVAMAMITSIICFAIFAWLALRNDWGRKSRY